jgi:sulfatase modifying factor 1
MGKIYCSIIVLIQLYCTGCLNEQNSSSNYIEPSLVKVEGGIVIFDDSLLITKIQLENYYIGRYEVTNKEFVLFLNDISSEIEISNDDEVLYQNTVIFELICTLGEFEHPYVEEYILFDKNIRRFKVRNGCDNYPVGLVTYHGAKYYCHWLSLKTGKNYKLPSESEWIFAAKGGNESKGFIYSGSNLYDDVSWCGRDYNVEGYPMKVGEKEPNELGIYDMSGNVSEWCDYNYETEDTDLKILKGGNILEDCKKATISSKRFQKYDFPGTIIGFRIVLYDNSP